MKTKFFTLLTAGFTACMFAACSSDSNSGLPAAPEDPAVPESSSTEAPVDNPENLSSSVETPAESSSSVEGEVPVESSSSVVAQDPVVLEPVKNKIENTIPNSVSTPVEDFANYTYYGAELTGLDQFKYGRFEARMKVVSIPGSVSSMFLYYDNSHLLEDEPWNEIDIEILGKNKGQWQSNLITRLPDGDDGKKNNKKTSEFVTGFGFDATEDFHLYAMIWTPEYISWEIDSVEVRRDVIGMPKGQVEFMDQEQSLRFNLWAAKSTAWVGEFTGAELAAGPQEQVIDYVRVYKYDTATKTFTLDWQDDFDGDDLSAHWDKGTWDMEYVKYRREQVVVGDGVCKLLLSREAK